MMVPLPTVPVVVKPDLTAIIREGTDLRRRREVAVEPDFQHFAHVEESFFNTLGGDCEAESVGIRLLRLPRSPFLAGSNARSCSLRPTRSSAASPFRSLSKASTANTRTYDPIVVLGSPASTL